MENKDVHPENIETKISFHGGAQEVTGANHLLETTYKGKTTRVLVDCGLFQGMHFSEDKNEDEFSYNPAEIDALLVTHAHLDHIGRIPKLVKKGFRGEIFSTSPTRDFAMVMLEDSLGVMRKESRRRKRKEPVYSEEDIRMTIELWKPVGYHENFKIGDFDILFKDAGHILGSAMIEIMYPISHSKVANGASGKGKIVFSGDLGNCPNPLLRSTEMVNDADYLVIESTYGNRERVETKGEDVKLERVIEDTIKRKGVLMIPAFSLERTQKLLFHINNLVENGRIPKVPVFLDSPLAIKATRVYKQYSKYYNKGAKEIMQTGDDLFDFPLLKMTLDTNESKNINNIPAPKIIIAGSGMSNGGRIIHHERRYLPDPKSTLLLVGYQAAGSPGRQLQEGAKNVRIVGEPVTVRAKIEMLDGYSAHPDSEGLFDIVSRTKKTLKKVFVVQGEAEGALFFVQRIRDYLGVDAVAPKTGESFSIDI